jgi:hypothetical protein
MKYVLVITMLFLAGCKSVGQQNYPRAVDSLGLQSLYDDTKWNLYLTGYAIACE